MSTAPNTVDERGRRAWEALHGTSVWCRVDGARSLRLTGSDRVAFLRGRMTASLVDPAAGAVDRGLQLDVRGGAVAQATVHVRESDVHVLVEDGAAAELASSWRSAIVFDDVEVHDLSDTLVTYTLQGPQVGATVEALGGAVPEEGVHATISWNSPNPREGAAKVAVLMCRSERSALGGVDLVFLRRDEAHVVSGLNALGTERIESALLEASRVEAGIARAGTEAGPGVLPQEAGLASLVSFGKGCYLGQETMARVQARGRLKRGLARVRLLANGSDVDVDQLVAGDGVLPSDEITSGGRTVGKMGTVVRHPVDGWIGLAVVRLDLDDAAEASWRGASVIVLR